MTFEPVDGAVEPRIGDAFGEILLQCAANDRPHATVYDVTERDDGFVAATDAARWFARPEDWPAHEQWALDHVRGRVLDVGCGAGRHAVALASAGYDVVGLDMSAGAVAVARENGVDVIQGDLMTSGDIGMFDTILMLGYNLGLLRDRAYAPRVLTRLTQITSRGGRIVGSCVDPSKTKVPDHHSYHQRNKKLGRMPGQQRVRTRYRSMATPWYDYLYMSPGELADIAMGSSWAVESVNPDGPSYATVLIRDRPANF